MTTELKYTEEMYNEFSKLIYGVESHDQVTRINSRLNMNEFVEKHGKPVCDKMFDDGAGLKSFKHIGK